MATSEIPPPPGTLEPVALLGRPALAQHEKIVALIGAELGPADAALFARPRLGPDGAVLGWRAASGRAMLPVAAPARAALEARAAATLARVGALADRLAARGDAGRVAAHLLRAAMVTPTGAEALHTDGEGPVLAFWGLARPGQDRPQFAPPAPPAPPPVAASPVVASPVVASPGAVVAPEAAGPRLVWAVPLALLGVFGYVAWDALRPLDPVIVDVLPPAAQAPNPVPDLNREVAALRQTLAEIEGARTRLAQVCVPVPPPPPPSPAAAPPAPTEPPPQRAEAPAPDPAPAPIPAPIPAPAPVPVLGPEDLPLPPPAAPPPDQVVEVAPLPAIKPTPPRSAPPQVVVPEIAAPARPAPVVPTRPAPVVPAPEPEVAIQVPPPPAVTPPRPAPPQAAACAPDWPPGRQPRVVFVLDGSGSMNDALGGGGTRIGAAKSSIAQVVRGLHRDIRTALVSFSACGSTQRSPFYEFEQRPTLLGQVNGVRPQQGTSLAASIRRAGNAASSRAPTTVVVVSDGEDTCGGDPCAEARAARAAKPNLTINVIDLSGGGGGGVLQCVASAGGGRVFTPRNAGQMADQLQRATGQPDASACN